MYTLMVMTEGTMVNLLLRCSRLAAQHRFLLPTYEPRGITPVCHNIAYPMDASKGAVHTGSKNQ